MWNCGILFGLLRNQGAYFIELDKEDVESLPLATNLRYNLSSFECVGVGFGSLRITIVVGINDLYRCESSVELV